MDDRRPDELEGRGASVLRDRRRAALAARPLYGDDSSLFDKIDTIVKRIYRGGSEAIADKSVRDQPA